MVIQEFGVDSKPIKAMQNSATESGKYRVVSRFEGRYFGLSEAGMEFYRRCDGRKTLREIGEALVADFEVEATDTEEAVLAFASYLVDKGMIQFIKPR